MIASVATILTRFIPFMAEKPLKKYFSPVFGFINTVNCLLVGYLVYLSYAPENFDPEYKVRVICGIIVIAMHLIWRNLMISVFSGSILYIFVLNYFNSFF